MGTAKPQAPPHERRGVYAELFGGNVAKTVVAPTRHHTAIHRPMPPARSDDVPPWSERAAIIQWGTGAPPEMAEALAMMCEAPTPAGYTDQQWAVLVNEYALALDRWCGIAPPARAPNSLTA